MSAKKIVVYGASGHGKVVADILIVGGSQVAGFVDDAPELVGSRILGLPVLGGAEWVKANAAQLQIALGIGRNYTRSKVAQQCVQAGAEVITAIHPSAMISRSAVIGAGTVVMAGVAVNPEAHVGAGVILNTCCVVEHDCVIGDYAHLSPNSAMGGAARLGASSWLGMGAVIIHCVAVGVNSTIGAGAVVVRDIPDGVVAVGVPARIIHRADEAKAGAR